MLNEIENLQAFNPWRRYFARTLDLVIYNLLWTAFIAFVFNVNVAIRSNFGNIVDSYIAFVIMLFLEPLLLHFFGSTLGKSIFGFRVERSDGSRLSYREGLERTWGVISSGMGYNIPIYNLIRAWKSYTLCTEYETQPWDEQISYTIKDTKWYRGVIYIIAYAVSLAVLAVIISAQLLPPNKGDLTIEEFVENYNYYVKHFDINFGDEYLDENGKWSKKKSDDIAINLGYNKNPQYQFITENGYVTGFSFAVEVKDYEYLIGSYDKHMQLATFAYVGAQNEIKLFSKVPNRIVNQIERNSFEDFNFEEVGITINCDIDYSGYNKAHLYLIPDNVAKENYFYLKFTMNK